MSTEQGLVLVNKAIELYRNKVLETTARPKNVKEEPYYGDTSSPGFYKGQVHIGVNKLVSAVTAMSWDMTQEIVNKVFDQQLARCAEIVRLLDSGLGTWTRGRATFKCMGKGRGNYKYVMMNVATGYRTSVPLGTIIARWVHNNP